MSNLAPKVALKTSGSRLVPAKKRSPPKPKAPPEPVRRDAPGYAVGNPVSHPDFGNGTVTAIEDDKLTIEFVDRGVKQIVHHYVKHRT
jgi:Protein of unknown function (DUF3553)